MPEELSNPAYLDATTLSVVVPAYNEVEVLPIFHARLRAVMTAEGWPWEVVYVNDGSRDGTLIYLESLAATESHVSLVNLSRNFGKEAAMTAGLDHARGAAVIVIDADLQDPPELIPEMIALWHSGIDMIYAQRRTRAGESWIKRSTADAFYRLMRHVGRTPLPPNVGDFRLMSRRVVNAVLKLREQHRFMKGVFAWVGFPSAAVLYDRDPRAAGETKWNFWKLWNFSLDGITSYTVMPLKIATYLGLVVALISLLYGGAMILRTLLFGNPVPGYPSLMVVILFLGGVQLITLGIMGEYLGRAFDETKHRPLYLVERYIQSGASTTAPQSR